MSENRLKLPVRTSVDHSHPTKVEKNRRVRQVAEFIDAFQTTENILEFCESEWKVGRATGYVYMKAARALVERNNDRGRQRRIYRHVRSRELMIRKALEMNDVATASRVLKDLGEYLGDYAPKKTELSGPNGGPMQVQVTDADLISEMRRWTPEQHAAYAAFLAGGSPGSEAGDGGQPDSAGDPGSGEILP